MLFRVDPRSSVGLADQIAGQVRGAIADGSLVSGDRLPPARELAQSLEVNMHTVLRAYAALRDDDLIELRRGRGAQVRTGAADELSAHADLRHHIDELVRHAGRLGLTREQVLDRVGKALS